MKLVFIFAILQMLIPLQAQQYGNPGVSSHETNSYQYYRQAQTPKTVPVDPDQRIRAYRQIYEPNRRVFSKPKAPPLTQPSLRSPSRQTAGNQSAVSAAQPLSRDFDEILAGSGQPELSPISASTEKPKRIFDLDAIPGPEHLSALPATGQPEGVFDLDAIPGPEQPKPPREMDPFEAALPPFEGAPEAPEPPRKPSHFEAFLPPVEEAPESPKPPRKMGVFEASLPPIEEATLPQSQRKLQQALAIPPPSQNKKEDSILQLQILVIIFIGFTILGSIVLIIKNRSRIRGRTMCLCSLVGQHISRIQGRILRLCSLVGQQIIWIGVTLIVLMALFPPWTHGYHSRSNPAGYKFLLSPPTGSASVSLDYQRLLMQWAVVGIVIGAVEYKRRTSDKKNRF